MQGLFQNMIFALIAGFSEFLPVSAPAHYSLYQYLTGIRIEPILLLAAHIGCLMACVFGCRKKLKHMRIEKKMSERYKKGKRKGAPVLLADHALLNAAVVPVVLGYLVLKGPASRVQTIGILALMLLINGIIMFIPRFVSQGNKDGRSLSRLDGLLMGLGNALGVIPGFSRLGCSSSMALLRGADRNYAVDNSLLLSIPAFLVMICFDIYATITAGLAFNGAVLLMFLLVGSIAFGCGYLMIALLRLFSSKTDLSVFAYYSWGLALFAFLLHLVIY